MSEYWAAALKGKAVGQLSVAIAEESGNECTGGGSSSQPARAAGEKGCSKHDSSAVQKLVVGCIAAKDREPEFSNLQLRRKTRNQALIE